MDFWDVLLSVIIMIYLIRLCNHPKLQAVEDRVIEKVHGWLNKNEH